MNADEVREPEHWEMSQISFILGNHFIIVFSDFESAITQKISEV